MINPDPGKVSFRCNIDQNVHELHLELLNFGYNILKSLEIEDDVYPIKLI